MSCGLNDFHWCLRRRRFQQRGDNQIVSISMFNSGCWSRVHCCFRKQQFYHGVTRHSQHKRAFLDYGNFHREVFETGLASSLYQVCDPLIAVVRYWHLDKVIVDTSKGYFLPSVQTTKPGKNLRWLAGMVHILRLLPFHHYSNTSVWGGLLRGGPPARSSCLLHGLNTKKEDVSNNIKWNVVCTYLWAMGLIFGLMLPSHLEYQDTLIYISV